MYYFVGGCAVLQSTVILWKNILQRAILAAFVAVPCMRLGFDCEGKEVEKALVAYFCYDLVLVSISNFPFVCVCMCEGLFMLFRFFCSSASCVSI